ncbi:alpha/beta fold hydrolase [Cellulophaga baltica]|uniref:alpha/beta fold hydrolase n=1 Tax=Cellulophaga baltica TaxID=76594 RepID=UPI002148B4D7|nr:alpha/beta fold hydrolase [Cellulophaga baltica]MCR1027037.1 alpha/beta fold hydrolase [Cellulophaga baltica]
MKVKIVLFLISYQFFSLFSSSAQTLDTIIDVNSHKLHFNIIKGKGIPILFETGSGGDCNVWNSILKPISKITGTTLITYDRAGFGQSTINEKDTIISNHGIISEIKDLEFTLKKLGYDKEIMLVSHSYGGYYSTLYSDRHPKLVKSIVLIDVNHNFMEKFIDDVWKQNKEHLAQWQIEKAFGWYYLGANIRETINLMSKLKIPEKIPVTDIINGIPIFEEVEKIEYWKKSHEEFLKNHPKSIGITANECRHIIWEDNPNLVIIAIAKSYAEILNGQEKISVYDNALKYSLESLNYKKTYEVTIRVTVPNDTDDLFITGNQESLAKWNPKGVLLQKVSENIREIKLKLTNPTELKFTLGNWEKEAIIKGLSAIDGRIPNIKIDVEKSDLFEFEITEWIDNNE